MTIGETIRKYRKAKSLTQGELAQRIGVSMQAVSKWETDYSMPDISQIVPLARILEVTTDRILGLADDTDEEDYKELQEKITFICNRPINNQKIGERGIDKCKNLYDITHKYVISHPSDYGVAADCVEYGGWLIGGNIWLLMDDETKNSLFVELERIGNSVINYDHNIDHLARVLYYMAIMYTELGQSEQSTAMIEKIPDNWRGRTEAQAEIAFNQKDYESALKYYSYSFKNNMLKMLDSLYGVSMSYSVRGKPERENAKRVLEYLVSLINTLQVELGDLPDLIDYKADVYSRIAMEYTRDSDIEKVIEYAHLIADEAESYFDLLRKEPDAVRLIEIHPDCIQDKVSINYDELREMFYWKLHNCYDECADKVNNPIVTDPRFCECVNRVNNLK